MWPVLVVVIHEPVKDPLEVPLVQDQQPVETFRAGGAYEPLGTRVGLWRAERRANDVNPVASEHVIKTLGEFLIPIANQKPYRLRALRQRPRQLASLLDDPWRARIGRATRQMHTTATQLNEEEDVQSLQPNRIDREEIDGQ